MANSWISDVDSKLYTLIKSITRDKLVIDYPDIFYTTENVQRSEPKFPTIFIQNVSKLESNQDLENDTINAVTLTYEVQIQVDNANFSSDDCYTVLNEIVGAYKSLRFNLVTTSSPTCLDGVWSLYVRFRREVTKDEF